jgi:peptidoglycan hydrolase-like protein with peptidoglycan-binding domain
MARLLFARGATGEIVKKIQRALQFKPADVDGIYGKDTEKALVRFQTANSLEATGTMDVATWAKLMVTPVPPVRERSLQLTGAFEGHGFTLAQGNFDGAGITWGIIGFTLIGGELGKFFKEINQKNPELIAQAFQGSAKQLLDVFRAPKAEQLAFANSVSLGASKVKLAEPWRSAFQRFGEMPEVQAQQLELADRDYFQPALQTASQMGLKTELGISLCFDVPRAKRFDRSESSRRNQAGTERPPHHDRAGTPSDYRQRRRQQCQNRIPGRCSLAQTDSSDGYRQGTRPNLRPPKLGAG